MLQSRLETVKYKHPNQTTEIIIVGCGGTGSYLVRDLPRILLNCSNKKYISIILIDGDIVEEKNIDRQNFTRSDIGKYKAQVLADRYGAAYGIPMLAINEYLTNTRRLRDVGVISNNTLLIGCVDNNKTRLRLHSIWARNVSWIDCGNEKYNGQVVFGAGKVYNRYDIPKPITYLFPSVVENLTKAPDEQSCAELAMSGEQTMMANMMAANIALQYVDKIIYNKTIEYNYIMFDVNNSIVKGYPIYCRTSMGPIEKQVNEAISLSSPCSSCICGRCIKQNTVECTKCTDCKSDDPVVTECERIQLDE